MSRKAANRTRRSGKIRCAIYTRKSSEEGLEQEFNSLQAQREACEAFIKSQRHEGWVCLSDGYDDGGLVVVDSEAETVRCIFRRYAELGSIRLLQEELDAQGLTSKCWTSASGRLRGGKPFARGALYLMLQNRIYP